MSAPDQTRRKTTTARKDKPEEALEPSVEVMLAEHERISALYLYNLEQGEKRVSLYLALVSAGAVALAAVAQFQDVRLAFVLWPAIGFVVVLLLIGVLTFRRLIERRIRSVEYLRAINRIHRYFVQADRSLGDFFYWSPCDDVPHFGGNGTAEAGLRDVVTLLNSLFAGLLVGLLVVSVPGAVGVQSLAPGQSPWWLLAIAALVAVGSAFIAWWLHRRFTSTSYRLADRMLTGGVRFPRHEWE